MKDQRKTKAQLLEELAQLRQQLAEREAGERQKQVLSRVRNEIWRMEHSMDLEPLLIAIHDGLQELGISFNGCGVNLIDEKTTPPSVLFNDLTQDRRWLQEGPWNKDVETILQIWRQQVIAYRRDLETEDPYGERRQIEADHGGPIRSVIDIPFSHGTLAVNSIQPDAFSPADIEALQQMAQVLSEAFARREDLQHLERRTRELEEKDQLLSAYHQIGQQMLSSLDLDEVLDGLAEQIASMGIFRSLMIALVDEEARTITTQRSVFRRQDGVRSYELAVSYDLDSSDILAEVARTGRFEVIEGWDEQRYNPEVDRPENFTDKVAYYIPVKQESRVLAVLATASRIAEKEETLRRIEVMQPLLDQVAIALEHTRIYEQILQGSRDRQHAEEALRISQERYHLATQAARVGVWDWNIETNEFYLDPNIKQILGYTDEEIPNDIEVWVTYVHPEDQGPVMAAAQACIDGETPVYVFEHRMLHKDGSVRWIMVRGTVIRDPQGCPIRMVGTDTDITQRQQAEENQRQANRLLRTLSQVNQILVRAEDEAELMQAICRIIVEIGGYRLCWVGYAQQDAEKSVQPVAQWGYEEGYLDTLLLTWADTERGRGPTGTALRTGKPCFIQNLLTDPRFAPWRAEAEKRGYAASMSLPLSMEGQCLGALNIYASEPHAFDPTEVQLLEELADDLAYGITALRTRLEHRQFEENLKIELALQRLRNAILQMESETDWEQVVHNFHEELKEWIRFNACSINIIDLQEGTLISYAVGPKKGVHQNIRKTVEPNLLEALAATMETGRPWYRRNRQDPLFATRLPPEVNAVVDVPFLRGTVAINSTEENAFPERDIEILEKFALVISQAFRRLEDLRALAQTEKRFQQAQKLEAVGQLAGGVAHDFNNLLTIISGYSQMLLLDLSDNHSAREEVEEIYRASQRGSALVRQLLAFSRRQVLHPEVLNLNALIADLEKMVHRLLGEDITLELKLAPSLSPVLADEGQIQQILMNLVINARDAMPDGGQLTFETADVELKEGHVREGVVVNAGPYVKLAVRDTGMGMDEATRVRVFEPFFTTKESGKGTGLGLSTVYGIVKQSEGYVWVLSEPGQGATFEIYLPHTAETTQKSTHSEPRFTSQGTETILLVEDDEALRSVTRRMLKQRGYQVLDASSGPDALRLATQTQDPIHLLLTDLVMPEMNGRELVQTLSALHSGTKVLYMSGYGGEIADRHGVLEPGTAFLQKPFTLETLSQKVREVLDAPPFLR